MCDNFVQAKCRSMTPHLVDTRIGPTSLCEQHNVYLQTKVTILLLVLLQSNGNLPGLKPGLLGPFEGTPSFAWQQETHDFQARLQGCKAESPLYSTATRDEGFHERVVPLHYPAAFGMPNNEAASSSSSAPRIGLGLLCSDDSKLACILCVGDAIQYGDDNLMGIIQQIDWPTPPSSGLSGSESYSAGAVTLTVAQLKHSAVSGHVSVPSVMPRPSIIKADQIHAQLHIVSKDDSLSSFFPQGTEYSHVGESIVFCSDEDTMSRIPSMSGYSWERAAAYCLKLDEHGLALSGICR